MVGLSIICLRYCLDGLRLCAAGLLTPELHSTCRPDRCSIDCLRDLCFHIYTYIEELSMMMFKKVNLRDRRWWLSTFYSLCVQSYVRRALLVLEQQLTSHASDDADLNSEQYLHLITVLFIAVSFQYDPLSNGRLQQTLADDSTSTPETTLPELYLASASKVCGVESWPQEGIKSSYQFLTRMFNIGSLDFYDGPMEVQMTDCSPAAAADVPTPVAPAAALTPTTPQFSAEQPRFDAPQSKEPTIRSFDSIYSSRNSSHASFGSSFLTQSTDITSPHCGSTSPRSSFSAKRNSLGSIFSIISGDSLLSPPPRQAEQPGRLLPPPPRRPLSVVGAGGTSFVCACCPKRPQTFQTSDELRYRPLRHPTSAGTAASILTIFSLLLKRTRSEEAAHLRVLRPPL